MIVKHNITAMNANRMLGVTTNAQAKSTEKLSSGYKINRAADDAAGLAISEKMRRQIRGLTQASANAQDGISAVQTAEGALTEVHDMLQRLNELAVKAGNGTQSEDDRQKIQDEIDQIVEEIDRVSETTKFNETYLLKGSGKNKNADEVSANVNGKVQEASVTAARGNIYSATFDMAEDTKLAKGTEDTATITYLDENGDSRSKDVTFKTGANAKETAANLADAINADSDLKKVFKASGDAKGEISVESKLDGTKTDNTKNAVTAIEFASASNSGAARINQFVAGSETPTAATGESYALALGTFDSTNGAPAMSLDLQDGDSITINGKTYTYDANKNSTANSFASLQDLQDLLGSDYEVGLQISGTVTSQEWTNNAGTVSKVGDASSADFSTTVNSAALSTALGTIAATDFATKPEDDADPTAATLTAGNSTTTNTYSDLKVTLNITAKADAEKASDILSFSLQVGADTTEENKINVDIESMGAKSLGINGLEVTGEDSTNADEAVNKIADAINKVSRQRSALGAVQNRLEHTINNLDNVVENTTSAEAAIRDTDIANEMVKYSNNNILQQAGTSMLSQANQSNQLALSLLG